MSVPGFSSQKCQQRSRVAAARFGVEAAPLRFRGSLPQALKNDGFASMRNVGSLPDTPEAALALINARLPEGAAALTGDDVYVHFLEAANSNFVGDRSLYLADSTLQNIAIGGQARVAFMNAHRTGGLSAPSELPFGQTFCGCYEEGFSGDGRAARRATLGVFMLRGVKPNGDNGPTTDDLDAGMRAGTIADVSVGLGDGDPVCDICGHDLREAKTDADGKVITDGWGDAERVCPHYPGTHGNMTDEQIAAQQQRDPLNAKGVATYTLHNATLGEVSAVYDGAVPGAGVRKVMQFAKNADMSREDVRALLHEAFDFYGPLLPFDLGEVVELKADAPKPSPKEPKMDEEIETNPEDAEPDTTEPDAPVDAVEDAPPAAELDDTSEEEDEVSEELASAPLDATPENIARLQSQLARQTERLSSVRQSEQSARATALQNERAQFATSMREKIPPVARGHFNTLFAALQGGSATPALLQSALGALPKSKLFEPVQANLSEVDPPTEQKTKLKADRKKQLLSATATGRQVLADQEKEAA